MMPASAFVLALLLAGGIVLGSVLALRGESAEASCEPRVSLAVTTSAQLAPVVTTIADAFEAASPEVAGQCVAVTVDTRASADTVAALSTGWTDATAGPAPDVWIPESKSWLGLARTSPDATRLVPETGTTIATSPVVVAVPRDAAQVLGWPQTQVSWGSVVGNSGNEGFWAERGHPEWGPFRVGLPDPASSSAGLSSVLDVVSDSQGVPVESITPESLRTDSSRDTVLGFERAAARIEPTDSLLAGLREAEATGPSASNLSAFPLPESELVAYNRGQSTGAAPAGPPATALAAFYPSDGVTLEEISYVVLDATTKDATRAAAAEALLAALQGADGRQTFTAAGFRSPDGTLSGIGEETGVITALPTARRAASGATLGAAAEIFRRIHERDATLFVVDSSRSMASVVPGTGGSSRVGLLAGAASQALDRVSDESELGLWRFASQLDEDRDWSELCPIGPLAEQIEGVARRDYLENLLDDIDPAGEAGLYDTALGAFRKLDLEYAPGKSNQVVLVTDGINDDPAGGIGLDELLSTLRAEFDPERPVRVVTIAYGADADPDVLRQISEATGATSYSAENLTDVPQVLAQALLYD